MKAKTKTIRSKIVLALTAIVLLSAGCGGSSQPVQKAVTLTIWDPFMDTQSLQPLFDAYKKTHSNVTIVYTKKDVSTYNQDLLNALASGTGPDIYSINNAWLPQYMDKATSAPSSVFTYSDFKNTFVDPVINDFSVNQKIYGVAMSVDSLGLYYNKDLMGTAGVATPPKTWAELSADVQKIKRQNSQGYFSVSGLAAGTNSNVNRAVDILYLMMLQQGTVPVSNDGRPTFADQVQNNGNETSPGLNALTYYTSFATPSNPNYNWNMNSDYSIDAFVNGRAAFLYSYSYTRQTILQKSPNLNFDVAPVPQPDLNNPSVNFSNYWGQVVSRQTKAPNTAWDLLKFLTSKSSLDTYYAQNKVPSSRRDLISLQVSDPDIGIFANANLTSKSFYRSNQAQVDNIFGTAIDNIILHGTSPQNALDQAESQATALVQAARSQ